MSFAPEAHLPRERRLVIDSSGLTFETSLGVLQLIPWHRCAVVMVWPDRAELVLDNEVSVVIRARDWHHGAAAVAAVRSHAPAASVTVMPADPEPRSEEYVLRGLAASSSAVLVVLALGLLLVCGVGVGAGAQDKSTVAVLIGLAFGAGCLTTSYALYRRLRVPARFRTRAGVRGRASVALDSGLARAPGWGLRIVQWSLFCATAVLAALMLAGALSPSALPVVPFVLAFAVARERQRREGRNGRP